MSKAEGKSRWLWLINRWLLIIFKSQVITELEALFVSDIPTVMQNLDTLLVL